MAEFRDNPPAADQRIDALHVWIATYPDGSEGICSGDFMPFGGGEVRHMPLMSGNRGVAERLENIAMDMLTSAAKAGAARLTVELRTYVRQP